MTRRINDFIRILFFLSAILIYTIPAYSSDTETVKNYLSTNADISSLAEKATRKKYPDANAVLLNQSINIKYRTDGTWTQWHEAYMKILTKKGREDNLTISSYYTIPYQNDKDCRIDLVEIIKPDGSVKKIDIAKQSSVSIQSADMSSNIYDPNSKSITVNIKGLEVGDTLHYQMYDNTVLPRARGIFTDAFSLEGTMPILNSQINITGPADFPLRKSEILDKIPNTVSYSQNTHDGQITYTWKITDVPQAIPEPNMPSMFTCTQRLLVSTAPDWESISRWYWKLSEPALQAVNNALKDKVSELIKGADTAQEKIARIFKFVSQDIRYLGITTETIAPGLEPHPVSQTFDARYGVCRDKAALLAAMLRQAGIESFPVLIQNGDKKDIEVPNTYFNHAITAAKVDGKYILMDSTDENTSELLPAYLNNRSYLVATPEGDTLRTSEITPASQNLVTIETSGKLSENGILTANSKIDFSGINDNAFRGYFSRINPEERKRLFESVITKVYGGGKITACEILPKNLLDTSKPLTANISYITTNILAKENGLALMPAPFLSKVLGLVNNIYYSADLEKRRFPLVLDFTSGVKEDVKISIEKGIKKILSLPVYSPVKSEQLLWTRSLAQVKNNIIGNNTFMIKSTEFSSNEYNELKKALNIIEYNSRKKPVLAVNQKLPQVVEQVKNFDILANSNITYNMLSKTGWERIEETSKKILTYAGKKDNSEILINYNPVWEDVEIVDASITSKDGQMQTINKKEINIMDQDWNGLAPRYPGGKTLVASLPSVEIGSTIDYKIKHIYKNRPFFSMVEPFGSFNPLSKSVTINGLDELNVQSMWNGPETKFDREHSIFRWNMSNLPIKKELFLPPSSSFLPTVAVSNGNWYSYTREILKAFSSAAEKQVNSEKLATELTKDINDPIKRISVIRDYIATNIRLAGPTFASLPLTSISPADITLKEGYGNTTDRAILFYAMLKAIGENPKFYITTPFKAAEGLKTPILENPQEDLLQEVLIKLEHSNVPIWLNDTSEYAQLGTTPNIGNIVLNLQTSHFEKIKVYDSFMPEVDSYYFVDLNDKADATIKVKKEFFGNLFEANNKMFSHMTPEEKKIFYQEELTTIAQAATAASELSIDFDSYPGNISYSANIPKFAIIDNEFLYFNLPKTLGRIFNLRSDTRENPLYIGENIKRKIHILIALPKNYRAPVIAPANMKWNSPMYNGNVDVESLLITPLALKSGNVIMPINTLRDDLNTTLLNSRNALYITMSAKISPALYPSALYPQVLAIQNKLFSPAAQEIMLKNEKSADNE